jgi:hypothetical protein
MLARRVRYAVCDSIPAHQPPTTTHRILSAKERLPLAKNAIHHILIQCIQCTPTTAQAYFISFGFGCHSIRCCLTNKIEAKHLFMQHLCLTSLASDIFAGYTTSSGLGDTSPLLPTFPTPQWLIIIWPLRAWLE